jgi:hypothetical protein
MQDTVQTAMGIAIDPATAAALGGLALLLCLGLGRIADLAATRLGFGPLLGLTVLAASSWIVALALGIPALAASAQNSAYGVTLAVVGVSVAFLGLVYLKEGRLAPDEE